MVGPEGVEPSTFRFLSERRLNMPIVYQTRPTAGRSSTTELRAVDSLRLNSIELPNKFKFFSYKIRVDHLDNRNGSVNLGYIALSLRASATLFYNTFKILFNTHFSFLLLFDYLLLQFLLSYLFK